MSDLLQGFKPVADQNSRVLVLGSMPGVTSLQQTEYYAHPRNAFWPIMSNLFGFPLKIDYQLRLEQLRKNRIALWDVIGSCRRKGSLDSDIDVASIKVNDFSSLFTSSANIQRVLLNGGKADVLFRRFVPENILPESCDVLKMPSTSPAYAAMSFQRKLEIWREAIEPLV